MRRRELTAAGAIVSAIVGLLSCPRVHACAVCATGDPTLRPSLAESAYAGQFRIDLDVLAGRTSAGAADARWLTMDDRRVTATLAYAPSRDVSFALVVPMLVRTLRDGGGSTTSTVMGDVEARAQQLVWRGEAASRARLTLIGGVALPTAPVAYDSTGAQLPSTLQPGCSGLEPFVGASYAAGRGRWSGDASALLYLP
ncbi:MAG: hypothetical protein ACHREM_18220, partial [Polyangiales bacterium]